MSDLSDQPRWWQHAMWRVFDHCSHRWIKVGRHTTLIVHGPFGEYDVDAWCAQCNVCMKPIIYTKRVKPAPIVRFVKWWYHFPTIVCLHPGVDMHIAGEEPPGVVHWVGTCPRCKRTVHRQKAA